MTIFKMLFLAFCAFLVLGCSTKSNNYDPTRKRLELANDYYNKGLLTQSESVYLELIKELPDLYEPYIKLGNIYVRTNQLEAAIIKYERAIIIKPDDVKAWSNLSLARVKQAVKVLEEGQAEFDRDSFEFIVLENKKLQLIEAVARK